MSMSKRYLENRIASISERSGYEEDFLMRIVGEMLDDGELDLDFIEAVAMERDF